MVAEIFNLTPSGVRTIRPKAKKTGKVPYRPLKLGEDQEAAVCEMIREAAHTGNYVTQREVLNFAEREFRKTLTYGWIDSFLHRNAGEIRRVALAPQELA
jgi:hypothetical protein